MKDSYFFDTNILAYAFDRSDRGKWEKCRRLVKDGFQGEKGCFVSNQVLAELFVVLTAKVRRPIPRLKAGVIVKSFIDSKTWKKVNYDHRTVVRALADASSTAVPFWDLLIAETMRDAGLKKIYTEDLRDFRRIPWVDAVNPL